MRDRLYSILRYSVAAGAGMIVGATVMFTLFVIEFAKGSTFTSADGREVTCIRTK